MSQTLKFWNKRKSTFGYNNPTYFANEKTKNREKKFWVCKKYASKSWD